MNNYQNYQNYQNINKETLSGRSLEADVLTRIANRLKKCKINWKDKKTLFEVFRINQKIWTLFQENLMNDNCGHTLEFRINVLKLIDFMDMRIYKIIANEFNDPSCLDILININNGIAEGLRR